MKGLTTLPSRALRRAARLAGRMGVPGFEGHVPKQYTYQDYYSISIYEGPSPLDLAPARAAAIPVLEGSDVTDIPATYVADPFMIRVGAKWFMFFEILPAEVVKGVIGVASSDDGLEWKYGQVVLEEPFHLSYPYVFESEGEYFMVPESNQDQSVRLYKAVDFPTRWELVGKLLEGEELVDPSLLRHEGMWWMFAGGGAPPFRADTMRLYYSERVTGPWTEHPQSPVISGDPVSGRPGGRVVNWNGRLFRFSQDCHPRYGLRVRAFEIVELTVDRYRECPASTEPILRESGQGWNADGMHHIDPHQLEDGSCMACVDGWYLERFPSNPS